MNLDRVTITGADDSVRPIDIADLSERFPFVEWGILVSRSQQGNPRYATEHWLRNMQQHAQLRTFPIKLSLHVCGYWVRQLLLGENELPAWMLERFQRVQLNFHAERTPCNPNLFIDALPSLGDRQVIFQIDGAHGNKHFESAFRDDFCKVDVVPLFDVSGGAGILPERWPQPMYGANQPGESVDDVKMLYHGYAGGLGPENLAEQIPLIAAAADKGPARFWIDMETRVRSSNDHQFNLGKVIQCLEIAEPYISSHENLVRSPAQV